MDSPNLVFTTKCTVVFIILDKETFNHENTERMWLGTWIGWIEEVESNESQRDR